MYDRCLLCRGPLEFYGISIKPQWLKWLHCQLDDIYFATDEFGFVEALTKKIPKEAYFMEFKERERRG